MGQDRAGPGCSSCERTPEWFLEMCVPSELARGKFKHIATILELCDNFRQSATVLDQKSDKKNI